MNDIFRQSDEMSSQIEAYEAEIQYKKELANA